MTKNLKKMIGRLFALILMITAISCSHANQMDENESNNLMSMKSDTALIPAIALTNGPINDKVHPLSGRINKFLGQQDQSKDFKPLGLGRSDYLRIIDRQVRAMIKYQNGDGRIIDPVEQEEKFYTTPCFAHSVAVLVASAMIDIENDLAKRGIRALDISLEDMVNATVNGNHGDFYTWPVMFAYQMFKPYVSAAQLNSWDKKIQSVKVDQLYRTYNQAKENNWVLVHTAGEFLRAVNGFVAFDYIERMLGLQLSNFTALGMYNEYGNPLPYDLFPRHYLSGMLQLNYNGQHAIGLRDNLWKGAWTSLFMQSPTGELPTGYRSSHHIWNEAEQCVVFEIYAAAYARIGREKEAGAFKRAAMLSLNSIHQWIREDGSGYIVKNRYPIEARHGYETYSMHTCYNMLATSMLAQAWQFSNDSIHEYPSPADVGGFVLPILEPFHKIFANATGTYLEYETQSDKKYNPTGIIRAHIKNAHPQLGPSNGVAPYFGGEGMYLATGPMWQNEKGEWLSLAEHSELETSVDILEEELNHVKFKVIHNIKILSKKATIIETISIENQKITVKTNYEGMDGEKRISWPMLIFDGMQNVKVEIGEKGVALNLNGKGVRFEINDAKNLKISRSGIPIKQVNGIVEATFFEFKGDDITYSIKAY